MSVILVTVHLRCQENIYTITSAAAFSSIRPFDSYPNKMIWADIKPDEEMTADQTAVTQIPTHTYTPTPNDPDYRIDQKGGIMWLYLDQHLILRSILFQHPRRKALKCASTVLSSEGLRGRVLTPQKDATSSGAKYVTMQTRTCSLVMNTERSATTNRMNVGLQFGFTNL